MTEPKDTQWDEFYSRKRSERENGVRERRSSRLGAGRFGQPRVRLGALIAIAAAIGFIIWVAVGGNSSSTPTSSSAPVGAKVVQGTPPALLSLDGIKTLAASLGQPIYWLGTNSTSRYELRQLQNGYVYVRYLPPGAAAGDPRTLRTVGTYPMQNAFSVTQALAKASGNTALDPGHGGVAVYSRQNHTNAYVAFPGEDYQVEVFDPTPGAARKLVQAGQLAAIR